VEPGRPRHQPERAGAGEDAERHRQDDGPARW
jgi:hypothetical protein